MENKVVIEIETEAGCRLTDRWPVGIRTRPTAALRRHADAEDQATALARPRTPRQQRPRRHVRPGCRPRHGGPQGGRAVGAPRAHRGARLPAGRPRADRGRGANQSPRIGGRPSWLQPPGPGRERSGARADRRGRTASQWSGTVAVDDEGDAVGPAIIWMDSRGARAVRETVRGALNVQGYSPSKAAAGSGAPAASRLSSKDPVGHDASARRARTSARPAGLPRAGGLSQPATHRAGAPRTTPSRCTGSPAPAGTCAPWPTTTSWWSLAGLERSTLPALVPTGSVLGGLAPGAAELGLVAGTPRWGQDGRPALGRRTRGLEGGEGDFDGHLVGTSSWVRLPRPLREDRHADQHHLHPSGAPAAT